MKARSFRILQALVAKHLRASSGGPPAGGFRRVYQAPQMHRARRMPHSPSGGPSVAAFAGDDCRQGGCYGLAAERPRHDARGRRR
jgi:hypothetical protein